MNRSIRYGLILFLIILVVIFCFSSLFFMIINAWNLSISHSLGLIFLSAILASLIITIIIVSTLPILKDILATFRSLIKLENLSQPLLMRLSTEAPGTYHHTILVTNLAHKAAKTIGADTLLTRVGSYYHDIGKLSNPLLYIENQPSETAGLIKNPTKKAKEIINHVTVGIKLAKEYHLPNEVIVFIPEHHGTMVIQYLYQIAKKKNPQIDKKIFTYPGPKPSSKETAIVMLADAAEAKIRSLENTSDKNIEKAVSEIIENRISANQLEFSSLNKIELISIKKVFVEYLTFMSHRRIPYQKP